jgi:signal transduction histidine kinase
MSGGEQPARIDSGPAALTKWERVEAPALAILPYVMLVAASAFAPIVYPGLARSLITLSIAGLAGLWLLWGFTLHPAWRQRPRWMTVFFVVLAALMAVLVIRAPLFGFFSYTGYFFTFHLPRRLRMPAVAVVAVITATSQDGGLPKPTATHLALYACLVLVNVLVASGLVWFAYVGTEQNNRRREAVAELSEANRKLEITLAENAGLHEQLLTQAREAGVADERQRMAREIHDTLAQSLAGIITQLQAADQVSRDEQRRRHLDAAQQLARESLSEARRSVHALRPEPLEHGRIEEALRMVAERWSALHGVPATVTTTGPVGPMPPEAELTLLRTAQEALTNVAKHAAARRAGLTLSYFGDQVSLDIRDDGRGFSQSIIPNKGPATPPPSTADSGDGPPMGGYGLTAMRERVEGQGGSLTIESEPGAGTTISASLPLAVSAAPVVPAPAAPSASGAAS